MDKAEAWKAMQGNEHGLGKALSSYPNGDRDQRDTHAACLELEKEGKAWRYREGVSQPGDGQPDVPFVIWMPAAAPPAATDDDRP